MKIYEKKLSKIGNSKGISIPIKVINNLKLDNIIVGLKMQDDSIIIEKIRNIKDFYNTRYPKKIKRAGSNYKLTIPTEILEILQTNKFILMEQDGKIIIKAKKMEGKTDEN